MKSIQKPKCKCGPLQRPEKQRRTMMLNLALITGIYERLAVSSVSDLKEANANAATASNIIDNRIELIETHYKVCKFIWKNIYKKEWTYVEAEKQMMKEAIVKH
jgi:hypothetical protein